MDEQLKQQNKLLKAMLAVVVEMLPRHASKCYGLQVHPGNSSRCCDCEMQELKDKVRSLL